MAPAEDKPAEGSSEIQLGDSVDMGTFNQILEMDEGDPQKTFSKDIVDGFYEQAEETFASMDKALAEKDLLNLSSLAHFLKGSSATLGLVKVRDGCEKIQRYGKNENDDGSAQPDSEYCLKRITEVLKDIKTDYKEVEKVLKKFYNIEDDSTAA